MKNRPITHEQVDQIQLMFQQLVEAKKMDRKPASADRREELKAQLRITPIEEIFEKVMHRPMRMEERRVFFRSRKGRQAA